MIAERFPSFCSGLDCEDDASTWSLLFAAGTDSLTCISEEVSVPWIPRRPHTALGRTRKPQSLNWFWSQASSYSNCPTSNSEQTALRISSSKKKLWKNKHATITSVLPLLLIITSDALFLIKYFEASDFIDLLSYQCFVEDWPGAGEVAATVGSWTKNPLVGMEGKPRG